MKALRINSHLFELPVRSSSLKRRESLGLQTAVNSPASSALLLTRRANLQLKSRLQLRPLSSGAPSTGPSLGAPRRNMSEDGANVERKTFRRSIQMVQLKAEVAAEEEALLEAFRNALKVDHFTISAYDTAWVAMIPNDNNDGPLYSDSLHWLCSNQRQDGSWAVESTVSLFNSVLSTLACVVALRTWNMASSCIRKGERFLQEAFSEMKEDNLMVMSPGVFHALAELLEEASRVGISLIFFSEFPNYFDVLH